MPPFPQGPFVGILKTSAGPFPPRSFMSGIFQCPRPFPGTEARVTAPGFSRRGSLFGSWRRPLQNSRPAHDAGAFSSRCRISSRHFLRYLRHVRPVPRTFLRHLPRRPPSRFRERQAHTFVPAPEDDGGNSPAPDRSPIP